MVHDILIFINGTIVENSKNQRVNKVLAKKEPTLMLLGWQRVIRDWIILVGKNWLQRYFTFVVS